MFTSMLSACLVLLVLPASGASADLSKYRSFQLGAGLPAVAGLAGVEPAIARTLHSRPAVIQELEWRPRPQGPAQRTEAVEGVVFGFYNSKLFRIAIRYDRYETEGLTADDMVEAISATYGPPAQPAGSTTVAPDSYRDPETILARWEDGDYRFELVSTSYGPSYKLTGVLKSVDEQARLANLEAQRLDTLEAPQRDAARLEAEAGSAKAKLDKARLVNKPKFRP